MRKTILLIILAAVCSSLHAQDPVQIIRQRLADGRISAKFSFRMSGKVPVTGDGTLTVEGNCYCLEGKELVIKNDGTTKWSVDTKAKEVYVDDSAGLEEFLTNPKIYQDLLSDVTINEKEVTGSYHDPDNGEKITFRIWNIKGSPVSEDKSIFKLDTMTLDSSWLVTDMRLRK